MRVARTSTILKLRRDASVQAETSLGIVFPMSSRLAKIGAVLANEARAEILTALMDGRSRTGGELARFAGVVPSRRQRASLQTPRCRAGSSRGAGPASVFPYR